MPIKWVVVGKNRHGVVMRRFFLRNEWRVQAIMTQLSQRISITTIEVILLCPECGEEAPQCSCLKTLPKDVAHV